MKAISTLIATVIVVAITIVAAMIVVSSVTNVMKSQTDTTSKTQKCANAGLTFIDYKCSNETIIVSIQNIGQTDLSNFTIFTLMGGNTTPYQNSSAQNSLTILKPGEFATLQAATGFNYNGSISKLVVSAGNCPGITHEITNDTITIGTC